MRLRRSGRGLRKTETKQVISSPVSAKPLSMRWLVTVLNILKLYVCENRFSSEEDAFIWGLGARKMESE